jgi:hypothetical protein
MRGIQARGLGEWNEKNALTPAPASVLSTDAAQRVAGSRPAKNGNVRFRMAAFPLRIDPTFSDDNWIGMGGTTANGVAKWSGHR